jgi:hypothetical protein
LFLESPALSAGLSTLAEDSLSLSETKSSVEIKYQPPDIEWVAQVSLLRPGFFLQVGPGRNGEGDPSTDVEFKEFCPGADRTTGVPYVRTSVRGPKTMGEALPLRFSYRAKWLTCSARRSSALKRR